MKCQDKFLETYRHAPDGLSFCPQRVVPVGAHSDYGLGKITGLALDKGIHIAYHPKQNGVVEVMSLQFEKRAQWHVGDVPPVRQGDWADYLRGATLALARKYPLHTGLSGVVEGSLPIGGLSSSAAVTIAFLTALMRVNGIRLTPDEMIAAALSAERDYVGVNVGTTDQSCEVYARENQLLYADTRDGSYELIPTSDAMNPYSIVIFFSGLERALAGSGLNMRVDEARAAAYALKGYAGMEYGRFGETNLRDVSREIYEKYKHLLPEPWRRRAEHWYTEQERVERAAIAWREGDIETYGSLSFESGMSSIRNWETGCPELKTLYEAMTRTEGIYGGRFSGAGFKGCCIALIDPEYEESVLREVGDAYLKAYPALRGKYQAIVARSADGWLAMNES